MHDKFAQLNHFQASPRNGWTQSWAGRALLQVWSSAAAEEAGGEPCPSQAKPQPPPMAELGFWPRCPWRGLLLSSQSWWNTQGGLCMCPWMSDRMQADAHKPTHNGWDERVQAGRRGLFYFALISVCWKTCSKLLSHCTAPADSPPLLLSDFCLF